VLHYYFRALHYKGENVSTRGLFVEDLAYETLRNLGFEIIEKRYRVEVDGIEVAGRDRLNSKTR